MDQGVGWKNISEALQLSKTTFYRHEKKESSLHEQWDDLILRMIQNIADSNNGLYGYRKMSLAIEKKFHLRVSKKRVQRLMSGNGIHSSFRGRKRRSWKKSLPEMTARNLLDRDFEASRPLEKLCSDITEISVKGTKRYLCIIYDLYCSYPLSWALSDVNDTALVLKALEGVPWAEGIDLFHTDRGSNYSCLAVQTFLREMGVTASMSRAGRCLDNASMESFNGLFKGILEVLFPDLETVGQLESAVRKTMDYYRDEYVSERYGIHSLRQIWLEGMKNEHPDFFPIAFNPGKEAFWKRVGRK